MVGVQEQNGLANFAGNPAADAQLDATSTNAVQNKVVTENINEIKDQLTVSNVTPTSNATIAQNTSFRIGKVVYINMTLSGVSSPLTVSDLPRCALTNGTYLEVIKAGAMGASSFGELQMAELQNNATSISRTLVNTGTNSVYVVKGEYITSD